MFPRTREKKTIPEMLPGKKTRKYDILYLDDLEKVSFWPLEAFTVLAEEIRDKVLAEIAGKRCSKKELFKLNVLNVDPGGATCMSINIVPPVVQRQQRKSYLKNKRDIKEIKI